MPKPIIAIDIDEVLFPFIPELSKWYNVQHKTEFRLEDYLSYDFEYIWGSTRGEAVEKVHAFLRSDHRRIQPVPQALEALEELKGAYRLVVITARDGQFEKITRQWLDQNFPALFADIILAGNHYTGRGFRTKADICRELSAVCLVDDSLRYVMECADAGIEAMLFGDYPWNQSKERLPEGVVRVHDWPEVVSILRDREGVEGVGAIL